MQLSRTDFNQQTSTTEECQYILKFYFDYRYLRDARKFFLLLFHFFKICFEIV